MLTKYVNYSDPDWESTYASIQMQGEGEAAYNNWLINKEIQANGGHEIEVRGSNYQPDDSNMLNAMNSVAAANPGLSGQSQMIALSGTAANYIVREKTSSSGQNYWDYYMNSLVTQPQLTNSVKLVDSNSDGFFDIIDQLKADGSEVIGLGPGNSWSTYIQNSHTTVNVASGTGAQVQGSGGFTVHTGNATNLYIGGNGQTTDDAHVINVYENGSTFTLLPNSRVNFVASQGGDTTINTNRNDNVGAYGDGKEVVSVNGFDSTTNLWIGGNGTTTSNYGGNANPIRASYLNGGTVTVVDNSSADIDEFGSAAKGIYVGSNSIVSTMNADNETLYLNGNHSQAELRSYGNTVYANGQNNVIDVRNGGGTVYASGDYNKVNDYTPQVSVYSQGNYQSIYNYYSGPSVYITYSTSSITGAPAEDYYYYWGFGGPKDHVLANIQSGDKPAVSLLANVVGQNGNEIATKSIDQLNTIISHDIHATTTGTRWESTTITWSFDLGGTSSGKSIEPQYRHIIEGAFDTWAKATGLNFKEVTDGGSANVMIGWANLDTKDTGLLGVSGVAVKNGHMQSGALISLENPTETSLIHGAGGGLTYEGTDATFEQVTMHEIGHMLGLGTNNDPSSIEYYLLNSDNRAISTADLNTIFAIYPELGHSPAKIVGPTWSIDNGVHLTA
jgi:hypothetical protein